MQKCTPQSVGVPRATRRTGRPKTGLQTPCTFSNSADEQHLGWRKVVNLDFWDDCTEALVQNSGQCRQRSTTNKCGKVDNSKRALSFPEWNGFCCCEAVSRSSFESRVSFRISFCYAALVLVLYTVLIHFAESNILAKSNIFLLHYTHTVYQCTFNSGISLQS